MASAFFKAAKPPFGRGVNLGNALEAPNEGEWGVKLEERFFDLIQKAGFDSVRIPVKWSAHADEQKPYSIDPEFMKRVDWAVEQALSRKLEVVLNIHHYDEMDSQPDAHRERFLAIWEQLAVHYKDRPAALAFELLNEPHDKLTAEKWNDILAVALKIVRRTNPTRRVVVGPVQWNSAKQLPNLKLPEEDRNLVVTFHFYDPYAFTHQGAPWLGAQAPPPGRKWQGTKAEQLQVIHTFDDALRWGVEHRRPIYLGEFGALQQADAESRLRWTKFIADQARERKFGTAYWEFCAGFGLYDREKEAFNEPLRAAVTVK
jgi:endoglucanase